jgi:hypothetical protein
MGHWALLWRIERGEEGGKLHVHFLMLWQTALPHLVNEFRPWNDEAWSECCGVDEAGKPYAESDSCCQVTLIRRWREAGFYVGKYVGKVGEGTEGRVWGIIRRRCWPVSKRVESVPPAVAVLFRRQLQRLLERRGLTALVGCDRWAKVKGADGVERPRYVRPKGEHADLACVVDLWRKPEARANLIAGGYRLKWWKPRLRYGREVKVWATVEESDGSRYMQHIGDERDQRHRAAYAVCSQTAERMLAWAWEEWLRRLEFDEGPLPPPVPPVRW